MELWELIIRECVRDLVTRYNSNGDSGRFDQVMDLFAPDAVMELDGDEGPQFYRGRDEIVTIFTNTRTRWAHDPGTSSHGDLPQPHVRHHVGTHQVDVLDESHASGYCYYEVIMAHGLDHWGRYFDRYRSIDGQWRFTYRKVTVDGRTTRDG